MILFLETHTFTTRQDPYQRYIQEGTLSIILFYIQQIIVIIQLFGIKVEGNFKLVLGSIYLLLGLAIIAMVFNLMGEKLSTQV